MGGIPRPFRPVGIVSGETPGKLPQRMPGRRGSHQRSTGEGTRLPEPACQPTGAAGTHAIETRTGGYAPRTVYEKKTRPGAQVGGGFFYFLGFSL